MTRLLPFAALACALAVPALAPTPAAAQPLPARPNTAAPAPSAPGYPAIPDPVDAPWPGGVITLDIDASDTQRAAFRVTETIPLPPGLRHVTLLYPQWLPGNHAPRGPIDKLAGLGFKANGRALAW